MADKLTLYWHKYRISNVPFFALLPYPQLTREPIHRAFSQTAAVFLHKDKPRGWYVGIPASEDKRYPLFGRVVQNETEGLDLAQRTVTARSLRAGLIPEFKAANEDFITTT